MKQKHAIAVVAVSLVAVVATSAYASPGRQFGSRRHGSVRPRLLHDCEWSAAPSGRSFRHDSGR